MIRGRPFDLGVHVCVREKRGGKAMGDFVNKSFILDVLDLYKYKRIDFIIFSRVYE
jgi:hypothetical protein